MSRLEQAEALLRDCAQRFEQLMPGTKMDELMFHAVSAFLAAAPRSITADAQPADSAEAHGMGIPVPGDLRQIYDNIERNFPAPPECPKCEGGGTVVSAIGPDDEDEVNERDCPKCRGRGTLPGVVIEHLPGVICDGPCCDDSAEADGLAVGKCVVGMWISNGTTQCEVIGVNSHSISLGPPFHGHVLFERNLAPWHRIPAPKFEIGQRVVTDSNGRFVIGKRYYRSDYGWYYDCDGSKADGGTYSTWRESSLRPAPQPGDDSAKEAGDD